MDTFAAPATQPDLPAELLYHVLSYVPRPRLQSVMAAASPRTTLGVIAREVDAQRLDKYWHVMLETRVSQLVSFTGEYILEGVLLWRELQVHMGHYMRVLSIPNHSNGHCLEWWPQPPIDENGMAPFHALEAVRMHFSAVEVAVDNHPPQLLRSIHQGIVKGCSDLPKLLPARVGVVRGLTLCTGTYHQYYGELPIQWSDTIHEIVVVFESSLRAPFEDEVTATLRLPGALVSLVAHGNLHCVRRATILFLPQANGLPWLQVQPGAPGFDLQEPHAVDPVTGERFTRSMVHQRMDMVLRDGVVSLAKHGVEVTLVNAEGVYDGDTDAEGARRVHGALTGNLRASDDHDMDDTWAEGGRTGDGTQNGHNNRYMSRIKCINMEQYLATPDWDLALDKDEVRSWLKE